MRRAIPNPLGAARVQSRTGLELLVTLGRVVLWLAVLAVPVRGAGAMLAGGCPAPPTTSPSAPAAMWAG